MLTNCPYNSPTLLSEKLKSMGIDLPTSSFLTSGMAAATHIKSAMNIRRVFLIGSPALEQIFQDNGLLLTEENPEAVMVGFDRRFDYDKMRKAVRFIHNLWASSIVTPNRTGESAGGMSCVGFPVLSRSRTPSGTFGTA